MNKNKIILTITIIIAFISFFGIIKYLEEINLYQINTFKIKGNNFIHEKEIKDIATKSIKKMAYNLNINEIQKSINEHSYINESKVYSILPSTIVILIKEILPIGLYENSNKIFFLDTNLNKIQANNKSINYYSVPVIRSEQSAQNNYKGVGNILTLLKNKNQKFYNTINELIIKEDIILIKIQSGTEIFFKKNKEINNTQKLLSFLKTIKNNKEITDYKYVDLTIPEQVIVKENNNI